jgi:uridine kinase
MAELIMIVGGTGSGKTTLTKRLVSGNENVLVYDVNNEYRESNFQSFFDPDFDNAITAISTFRDSYIIIEEATNFFQHGSSKAVKEFKKSLVAKRHQNNDFIMLFHALADIPEKIFNMVDTLILLKTKDNINSVKTKYSGNRDVLTAFLSVQEKPKHSHEIVYR